MFNNERRTSDAGKSYLPFALGFSLVVQKYKQLMFAEALGGMDSVILDMNGRDGLCKVRYTYNNTTHTGTCICIVRIWATHGDVIITSAS